MRRLAASGVIFLATLANVSAQRIELAWPTPNTAFLDGKGIEAFVQPTVSGEATSGLFGCVRSSGAQFHEGLDIKPVSRDRRGEPTDKIFAALPGVVRYVNTRVGESSYGRYIVLEHPEMKPAVFTLYGHLSAIADGIKAGQPVARGQVIATMGRSAGGYEIPKDRAHLHFEIGLWATQDFQRWYDWKKFGSANIHGVYNGMNLMGIDPLDFLEQFKARRVDNFFDYFARMKPLATVRIATTQVPDFVRRYPDLLTKDIPEGGVGGWEIKVNWTGIPFSWKPLSALEIVGVAKNEVRISNVDVALERLSRCKSIVVSRRGAYVPGKDLETMLQQVFGLR